jgi:hypothetical protein
LLPHSAGDFTPGAGGNVFADGLEQLADEALRRPVGHSDLSARAADADKLVGRLLLIRREHDAEGRKHDIEAGIREGKRFRVGCLERDWQAVGFGTLAAALEQRADIVRRHHVGEAAGRRERRIAVAGGDIEDALVAAEIDRLAQHLADDLQRGADPGVVAGAPGDLLAALDRGEIDGGGGSYLNVHRYIPSWLGLKMLSGCTSAVFDRLGGSGLQNRLLNPRRV